jgi:hypothetical protein
LALVQSLHQYLLQYECIELLDPSAALLELANALHPL